MCGIAGIYRHTGTTPDDIMLVQRMLTVLRHRGPDDEGVLAGTHAVFGHRRLSILDTSARGHQPMTRGQWTVVFNGEIYNYLELRRELAGIGEVFHTDSDTEVLLASWDRWGRDCLAKFEGMWAFALLHRATGEMVLARDPFGIKPLHVHHANGTVLFASEIKALLAAGVSPRANPTALAQYLVAGMSDYSSCTFFAEVEQVPPGGWIEFTSRGEIRRGIYYDLAKRIEGQPPTDIADFHSALTRSIELHFRSDVPIGTCLSGGLDSSTVAAIGAGLMRSQGGGRFAAITASSGDPLTDEVSFARKVVEHSLLDWSVISPSYDDFARDIRSCLFHQDEPVVGPSVYLQYSVMREAKHRGIKVLLDGQGGDESLLGYERYYATFFKSCLLNGYWGRAAREFLYATRHSKLGFASLLAHAMVFSTRRIRYLHWRRRAQEFIPEVWALVRMPSDLVPSLPHLNDISRLQVTEIAWLQMPRLLRYEDRNAMAHGVEARVPFVLPRCIEAAVRLVPEDKIRNGFTKHALRTLAASYVPPSIAWRRAKIGFEAPTALWLRKHDQEVRRQISHSAILRHWRSTSSGPESTDASLIWRLYNVAIWEELHGVRL